MTKRKRKIIKILFNNCERIEQINTHGADDKRSSHFLSLFFSCHAFILSSLIYRVLTVGTITCIHTTIISVVFFCPHAQIAICQFDLNFIVLCIEKKDPTDLHFYRFMTVYMLKFSCYRETKKKLKGHIYF
jgi:hypothetical protein